MTDLEMDRILKNITIIVDTRENKNLHIIQYLKDNNIPYLREKLDIGDYSIILPKFSYLELDRKFVVERKNSLNEIAGNFTKDRERFTREFERLKNESIHLVIENASWTKLLNQSYRSKLPPQSLMAGIMTFCIRYNCPVWFASTENSGQVIYNLLRYELREYLKNNRSCIKVLDKGK